MANAIPAVSLADQSAKTKRDALSAQNATLITTLANAKHVKRSSSKPLSSDGVL